ncbi:DNA uptake protein ComE-like DNA-binding protein [Arcticibacter pallidicorallinus]|uniref:DNA uptake protein ComE-like DNA-binding protein n=1 Tax=Arcticibacter pallidicorallinus TaxID=1259464 RepID=A0A2T0UB18_9SPHI|nr:helix-hairpin-helix domain-containing protein [Arcticibacter pallidicorallinus]PRY55084.1 DNA uptake protein ComE-like DNA-binding protein [Arcticibacter pallidicorallinus]
MNKWLNAVFGFSKKEQNGLIVLCILILLVLFIPVIYKAESKDDVADLEDLSFEQHVTKGGGIGRHSEGLAKGDRLRSRSGDNGRFRKHVTKQLFPFNPNHLPAEQWRKLGLTDRQIKVIHNYESKGGSFRRREDLRKIYSISEVSYRELAPYIEIPEVEKSFFTKASPYPDQKAREGKKVIRIIELNSADSAALVEVRGIGPVLASRILQYRNRLGGFREVGQLREVFGIDSVRYGEIVGQLAVDSSALRKIYINRVGFDELKTFPYLRYKQMNAIIQYRKQHGKYVSIKDLTKINILDAEILRKIAPYLIFDD